MKYLVPPALVFAVTFLSAPPIASAQGVAASSADWPDRTHLPIPLAPFKGKVPATVGYRFGIDSFGIGEDSGQPVSFDYKPPFKFTGEIDKVTVEIK